jgi:site-specific DNA-methyltransferase (adenine-specific)
MREVFSNEAIQLYHGNALTILPVLTAATIDAVVTDPPYSSGGVTLSARQSDPAQKYQVSGTARTYPPMLGDGKDQRSFTAWALFWLAECWRLAKDGAPILIFTDWRQLPSMTDAMQAAGWFWLGIVPWNKRSARPQMGKFRQQCEYVLFGSKGRFVPASRACLPGVYDYPVITQHKVHLTSKPVPLLVDLLAVTAAGGTILDPFIGGGTTAIAAMQTGRKCIGIELSEAYADIAAKRLSEAAQKK